MTGIMNILSQISVLVSQVTELSGIKEIESRPKTQQLETIFEGAVKTAEKNQQVARNAQQTAAESTELFSNIDYMFLAAGVCVLLTWLVYQFVAVKPEQRLLKASRPREIAIHPLLMIPGFIGFFLIGSIPLVIFALIHGKNFDTYSIAGLSTTFAGQLLQVGVMLLLAFATFKGKLTEFGLSTEKIIPDAIRGILSYLAFMPLVMGMLLLTQLFFHLANTYMGTDLTMQVHSAIKNVENARLAEKILIALTVIIGAPFAEEFFFRGFLQSSLRKYMSPWVAIFITSALFAMVHPWTHWPALWVLSLGFGYCYEKTGRLWPNIVMHLAFNTVSIVTAML